MSITRFEGLQGGVSCRHFSCSRAISRLDYQPLFRKMSPRSSPSPLLGEARGTERAAEIEPTLFGHDTAEEMRQEKIREKNQSGITDGELRIAS